MSERLKDKRADVRRCAMLGLAKIYSKHVSSLLPPLPSAPPDINDESVHNEQVFSKGFVVTNYINKSVWERLNKIPSALFNCLGYPDMSTRLCLMQLFQEHLIPKVSRTESLSPVDEREGKSESAINPSSIHSSSVVLKAGSSKGKETVNISSSSADQVPNNHRNRAAALLVLFSTLGDILQQDGLGAILSQKTRVRTALVALLSERRKGIAASSASTNGLIASALSNSQLSSQQSSSSDSSSGSEAGGLQGGLRKAMYRLSQSLPSLSGENNIVTSVLTQY